MTDDSLDLAVRIGVPALGGLLGLILLLVRLWLKALEGRTQERFTTILTKLEGIENTSKAQQATVAARIDAVADAITAQATAVTKDIAQLVAADKSSEEALGKVRDKWEGFLRDYFSIDATRSSKLDAAFRRVDEIRRVVDDLRPHLQRKMDDQLTRIKDELAMYARDQVRSALLRQKEGGASDV